MPVEQITKLVKGFFYVFFVSHFLAWTSMWNKTFTRESALCDVANLTLCDVTNACESDRFIERGVEINSFFENRDKCFLISGKPCSFFPMNWLISFRLAFWDFSMKDLREIFSSFFLFRDRSEDFFASRRHCHAGRSPNW